MARLRLGAALALAWLIAALAPLAAQPQRESAGLYDRPVLVVDPGMHTAIIKRASADAEGSWAVTGSDDKTVRVWSLADGALLRTIRLPAGPGNIGKVYAVAMSPDGALIAAGGFTRATDANSQEQIYLFDRNTGTLVRRVEGLPSVVNHLAFSKDGRLLAATLFIGGLRLYAGERDWAEIARDAAYGTQSYGADFSADGRLVTTSIDGKVRLYTGKLEGDIRPTAETETAGGERPYGVALSPDGTRLAVGYNDSTDSTVIDILDGRTLAALPRPDLEGIDNGNIATVAWSRDGHTLFAAGQYQSSDSNQVFAWSENGTGLRRMLAAGQDVVMSLIPLPEGDLLVAAGDPLLGRLNQVGSVRWAQRSPKADFRGQRNTLSVSSDATRVDFGFLFGGKAPARFDLTSRFLGRDPSADGGTAPPARHGPAVQHWYNTVHPTLDGHPLPLYPFEISRSLAVQPDGQRFVLGADWSLRAYDAQGTPLWTRPVPGAVWAVNISGDGRLVVAAFDDGTIRWHRMTDGTELLAFMPLPNRTDWVAWTPEGFYAATPGAHGILRWHVNRGWDAAADSFPIENIPGSYRPEALPLVLQELETPRALGLAQLAEHNREIAIRTHSQVPPGAQLHLLTIGISTYNEEYAKRLRLTYADRDAHDLASAIVNTQGSLYSRVNPQVLPNEKATKDGIMRALAVMRSGMERGGVSDLAVVHFSGHGALVDGKLYLLPYDVDDRDKVGIKSKGLWIEDLKGELTELAKHGRVLVLLDACHSGATTNDGAPIAMDSTALRTELASANITVLTSSSGSQDSIERPEWQHGAFTKALLDALGDPAADTDHNGLINANGLAHYVSVHVADMTSNAQTPGMEVRYEGTVFASAR